MHALSSLVTYPARRWLAWLALPSDADCPKAEIWYFGSTPMDARVSEAEPVMVADGLTQFGEP